MDLYCSDRKLSELGSNGFEDLLDQDMFTPPANQDCGMEHFGLDEGMSMNPEWLENFFDDPVLNDRMMTDALQPQRVQSEHSYSLANDGSPLNLKVETKKDLDMDLLNGAVNPNMTVTDTSTTTGLVVAGEIKQEPTSPLHVETYQDVPLNMSLGSQAPPPTVKITRTVTQAQTILKQPTIILATPPSLTQQHLTQMSVGHNRLVNVKVETNQDSTSSSSSPEHITMYDSIGLPPTPPSSSNCSDSEGSQSPQRSAPSSPIRQGHMSHSHMLASPYGRNSPSPTFSHPIFTSPIPTSGVLILSEEERRTLVSEGYPIPSKLPLTKKKKVPTATLR